jgi:uncharacterized protein YegJ (DUF2314 family)
MNEENVVPVHRECAEKRKQQFQEEYKNKPIKCSYAKIAFEEDDNIEHMWIKVDVNNGEKLLGRLWNNPVKLKNVKYLDEIVFNRNEIEEIIL